MMLASGSAWSLRPRIQYGGMPGTKTDQVNGDETIGIIKIDWLNLRISVVWQAVGT